MFKRIFDFTTSIILVAIFLPLLFVIMCQIFFQMGRPILFKQTRLGLNKKPFIIYKFRTMSLPNHEDNDVQRITPLGAFLRKTSMDELPELFNVIKGDMSLVGPRPLLAEYKNFYTRMQDKRHQIRPGITGWAQVNGRNSISWKKRFSLDVWYVRHSSFWLDIKILFLTLRCVFKREGVNTTDNAIMPKLSEEM